jgi:hypothetical protein
MKILVIYRNDILVDKSEKARLRVVPALELHVRSGSKVEVAALRAGWFFGPKSGHPSLMARAGSP